MKAYFVITNGYNMVVFEQDGRCKCNDGKNGYLDGIDLYATDDNNSYDVPKIINNLKTYFETNDINGFSELYGDEYDTDEIFDPQWGDEIIYICDID